MVRKYNVVQDSEKRVHLKQERILERERVECHDCIETVKAFKRMIDTTKLAEEHVFVLCFTSVGELKAIVEVSKGSINSALVPIRSIFQSALLCNAAQILIVHNHPSGDCTLSLRDKEVTERLEQAATIMEVPLLDHIVMGDDSFWSYRENRKIIVSGR